MIRIPKYLSIGALLLLCMAFLAACGGGNDTASTGEDAPEFSLPASDGSTVSLSDYVGEQPVLLYFHMAMG